MPFVIMTHTLGDTFEKLKWLWDTECPNLWSYHLWTATWVKFNEVGSKILIVGQRGSQDIDTLGSQNLVWLFLFNYQKVHFQCQWCSLSEGLLSTSGWRGINFFLLAQRYPLSTHTHLHNTVCTSLSNLQPHTSCICIIRMTVQIV